MKLKTPEYMNVRQNSDIETTTVSPVQQISTQARPPVSQTAAPSAQAVASWVTSMGAKICKDKYE